MIEVTKEGNERGASSLKADFIGWRDWSDKVGLLIEGRERRERRIRQVSCINCWLIRISKCVIRKLAITEWSISCKMCWRKEGWKARLRKGRRREWSSKQYSNSIAKINHSSLDKWRKKRV